MEKISIDAHLNHKIDTWKSKIYTFYNIAMENYQESKHLIRTTNLKMMSPKLRGNSEQLIKDLNKASSLVERTIDSYSSNINMNYPNLIDSLKKGKNLTDDDDEIKKFRGGEDRHKLMLYVLKGTKRTLETAIEEIPYAKKYREELYPLYRKDKKAKILTEEEHVVIKDIVKHEFGRVGGYIKGIIKHDFIEMDVLLKLENILMVDIYHDIRTLLEKNESKK